MQPTTLVLKCTIVLLLSICTQIVFAGRQEEKIEYSLHALDERSTKNSFLTIKNLQNILEAEKGIAIEFYLDGVQYLIEVQPSRELRGFRLPYLQMYQGSQSHPNVCDYEGVLRGITNSWIALSFCEGIKGALYDGKQTIVIESEFDNGERLPQELILKFSWNEEQNISKTFCGVPDKPEVDSQTKRKESHGEIRYKGDYTKKKRDVLTKPSPVIVMGWMRYIEVYIYVDYNLYTQFNKEKDKIIQRCLSIMNIVNSILKPLEISTVLSDVRFMENQDNVVRTDKHRVLLDSYSELRVKLLKEGHAHDYTIFLSGINFEGPTVGYAYVGTMCRSDKSTAVVQHFPEAVSASSVAGTIAHELGHTLGAHHDDFNCMNNLQKEKCLMTSANIEDITWSNCSLMYIAQKIDSFKCLKNVPKFASFLSSCGNGQLDPGEQCDCGLKMCSNRCCNAADCKLKLHANCASGTCCNMETCQPYPVGTLCRNAANECDLPEFCTGKSENCPQNVFKHDYTKCHSGKGTCYNGVCSSEDYACQSLINPSAKQAEKASYQKLFIKYNPCLEILCQPYLSIDRSSREDSSLLRERTFTYYEGSELVKFSLQNSDGFNCGDKKMCVNRECIAVPPLDTSLCDNKCSGHGVCNSNGNCHCDALYGPPNCSGPGFGGSFDSGHQLNPKDVNDYTTVFYVICLVFLCMTALTFCLWTNIKIIWRARYKDPFARTCPACSLCLDNCCCPCMSFLSRWLCVMGSRFKKQEGDLLNDHNIDGQDIRKTICQVEMNVKPPDVEVRNWGVASGTLVTDLITVTPKSSPRSTRKVRLPSDSPIFRTKSVENLEGVSKKPKYLKSISKDSGNVSDLEDSSSLQKPHYKSSMGSLISVFLKFGKQKSGSMDKEIGTTSGIQTKSQNLRRMVVDPLSSHRTSRHGTPPPADRIRPEYRRSYSTEVPSSTKKFYNSPSQSGMNTSALHVSEEHLHLMSSLKNEETAIPILRQELKPPNAEQTHITPKKIFLVPPHMQNEQNNCSKEQDNTDLSGQPSLLDIKGASSKKETKNPMFLTDSSQKRRSVKDLLKKFENS